MKNEKMMTAEQLIHKIMDTCENSPSCNECPLNVVTNGVCAIDSINWIKLVEIIKKQED